MIFLHSHGVSTSRSVRIFKTYGADAIQVLSENPYRLARDVRGIGFMTADTIAARLGIEKTAMIRARAGIGFTLTEAMDDGHCGLPLDELVPMAEQLLEIPASKRHCTWSWKPVRSLPTRSKAAAASSCPGCIEQNEPSRIA